MIFSAFLAMALAAPMSAANNRNHNMGNNSNRGGGFAMVDRGNHNGNAFDHNNHPGNMNPRVGHIVNYRPTGGRYVMHNGRRHWRVNNVLYDIIIRNGIAHYIVVKVF